MLKLSDIYKKLPFNVTETSLILHASELLSKDFVIDFDVYLSSKNKNLQRDFCWTIMQKSEFIISILKGIYIPHLSIIQQIFVHQDGTKNRIFQIIDGKQGLSTILGFIKNEFPITVNSNEYYFTDLDAAAQNAIEHGVPAVNITYEWFYHDNIDNVIISDDDKIAWFEMINWAGTPQDIEHMNFLKK